MVRWNCIIKRPGKRNQLLSGNDQGMTVKCEKLELKLKMMEISFEQINNSRNDMIKQLANCEKLNEKQEEKLKKLEQILNIDTVGWSSPRILIETIRREVIEK